MNLGPWPQGPSRSVPGAPAILADTLLLITTGSGWSNPLDCLDCCLFEPDENILWYVTFTSSSFIFSFSLMDRNKAWIFFSKGKKSIWIKNLCWDIEPTRNYTCMFTALVQPVGVVHNNYICKPEHWFTSSDYVQFYFTWHNNNNNKNAFILGLHFPQLSNKRGKKRVKKTHTTTTNTTKKQQQQTHTFWKLTKTWQMTSNALSVECECKGKMNLCKISYSYPLDPMEWYGFHRISTTQWMSFTVHWLLSHSADLKMSYYSTAAESISWVARWSKKEKQRNTKIVKVPYSHPNLNTCTQP